MAQRIMIVDDDALLRIFDNILSNTAEYSDGYLTVRLSPRRRGHV